MIRDPTPDVDIPRNAWSPWIPAAAGRQLRRALTPHERRALERRRDELAPAVDPYGPPDIDRVTLALSEMLGGFTSMRQTDHEAVAKIDSMRRILVPFPAWAIERACEVIRTEGVLRDDRYNRQWPPNDAEVVDAVRREARFFAMLHRGAIQLLAATVEGS